MDAVHKKIDGVEIMLPPTYAKCADLLLIGVTLS
jgi:hypothetical protein